MQYNVKTDIHTHTMASPHAYSTLEENIRYAASIGLEAIAMTNHGPKLMDAPHFWHFENLDAIPKYVDGVRVLVGCEANILNLNGELDLKNDTLDIIIAGIHYPCYEDVNTEGMHTKAYMNALENPIVDILGHTGRNLKCPYDIETVAKRAKELHKLIEINSYTLGLGEEKAENCRNIAKICKKIGTGISVSSDAHFSRNIGDFKKAYDMLSDIDFPEELIMNRDYETLKKYFSVRKEI